MTRAKTTKELQREEMTLGEMRRADKATKALVLLKDFERSLREYPKMTKLLNAIQDHKDWLIAEDESYMQAAAELFVKPWPEDLASTVMQAAENRNFERR